MRLLNFSNSIPSGIQPLSIYRDVVSMNVSKFEGAKTLKEGEESVGLSFLEDNEGTGRKYDILVYTSIILLIQSPRESEAWAY